MQIAPSGTQRLRNEDGCYRTRNNTDGKNTRAVTNGMINDSERIWDRIHSQRPHGL